MVADELLNFTHLILCLMLFCFQLLILSQGRYFQVWVWGDLLRASHFGDTESLSALKEEFTSSPGRQGAVAGVATSLGPWYWYSVSSASVAAPGTSLYIWLDACSRSLALWSLLCPSWVQGAPAMEYPIQSRCREQSPAKTSLRL